MKERLYGGLQRGSTCLQAGLQCHLGKYQGVVTSSILTLHTHSTRPMKDEQLTSCWIEHTNCFKRP